jgi:transcriptional regulator with XRE-family HTH domain
MQRDGESSIVRRVDAVLRNLGKRLRALRRAQTKTLEDLAGDTGFTTGYLSQIETGEAIPSLAALAAIATALGTDMAAFFPFEPAPGVHVSRVGSADKLRIAPNSRAEYMVLSSRRASAASTALIARYYPGEAVSRYSQFGERFALVLTGEALLHAGGGDHALAPGDCIHYTSHPEDTLDVVSHHPAELLWVVAPAIV